MLSPFIFRKILLGLTILLIVASLGARLGALHWLGDVLALPIDYYVWISISTGVGWLLLQEWKWSAIAGLLIILNGSLLLPYAPFNSSATAQTPPDPSLRILVYNLYYQNQNLSAVWPEVEAYQPDLVFLMEYSYDIQAQIESQFDAYPYRLIEPSRFTMGLALFSKLPLDSAQVQRFEATRIPIYAVQLTVDGQQISLVGGHPWPPQPQWGQLHRNQMADITAIAAQAPSPLIVAGDFNASQWSYVVRHLARQTHTHDAGRGFGLRKTWYPIPGFGLPIDHLLVSSEWTVLNYQHGNAGGSDHVPIIVDLALEGT